MGKPLPQATIDRMRRLVGVHGVVGTAAILRVDKSAVTAARKRGWKAAYPPESLRPRPSDFALLCDEMTIAQLRAHYRASDHTVRRWAAEVGRKPHKRGGHAARPIPDDLAAVVAELGPYHAATHYGVSYGTLKRWRKARGLPVSWSRRPKSERPAPTMLGWADRYFQQQGNMSA